MNEKKYSMKYLSSIVLFFLIFAAAAQPDFDLNQPIPVDPAVSKGVLDNGLTYYVRANNEPRNRAELMLVVNVGSVNEDDDQQGLAHFLEHMAFNGTESFPKNELISYFESIGMEFGPEINAYTSFDETVYMLKVPLDTALYLEKGLQVLYDWASQITLSEEEIDKERGVIREEWRGGRNAQFRMQQQWLPVLLQDSKYAERLPIGEIEIIENFKPDVLRRFYDNWYRPDLQAVIVVGDFNQEEMVQKVKDKFSSIKKAENPRELKEYPIPPHQETLVSIATDKEAQYPVAYVFNKHPMKITESVGDYRESIKHALYNAMINNRLSELTQKADPPYIMGQSSYTELFGPVNVYQSAAVCQIGRIEEGLTAVLLENERVKQHGFTESELERNKISLMNRIERAYKERDKQRSINYAEEYKRNFLMTKEPIPGIEKEYEYFKAFLPDITLEEVNSLADEWITEHNRVVVITAPEMEGMDVPSKEEVLNLLKEVEQIGLEPYDDAIDDLPLISDQPWGSPVVEEQALENVEATEWILENGARVVFKPTDFKDDEILFSAWSPGGTSLYGEEDFVSADFAATIMAMSGIAGFDNITLEKMLAGEVFSLTPYISELREGFNGSSTVKDLEVMLQMVYLYFTQPRFDETSFHAYMSRMEGVLKNRSASPEAVFQDTLQTVLANYHDRARPMTIELLKEAEFNRIREIGRERFTNAADFIFFFVGNIRPDTLKSLVEKYIGGIPSLDENEDWRNLGIDPPPGVVHKTVRKGQEDKSIQYIVFHGEFDYSSENAIELDAVGRILSTRLLEEIREERSGVYSIGANPSSSKYPDQEYKVYISYGTDPEKLEELQQAVFDEIRHFIENGPSEDELSKAKEKMLREREVALRENRFWLNILSNTYYLKEGDFSEFGRYNSIVKDLTTDQIREAFKKYFNFDSYVSVALQPGE